MLEGQNKERAWCVERNHMHVGKVEENKNPQQKLDYYPRQEDSPMMDHYCAHACFPIYNQ
jgi:hypothetical protein